MARERMVKYLGKVGRVVFVVLAIVGAFTILAVIAKLAGI
jgi:hypothetical protein